MPPLLTVVVPCYNEEKTLAQSLHGLMTIAAGTSLEVIIVDDRSRDSSLAIAQQLTEQYPQIHLIRQERNQGKGAAVRAGFAQASGDFVTVHDADLEYNPQDLLRMLEPLRAGQADVVFGSRFARAEKKRTRMLLHSLANISLTALSNLCSGLRLSDVETCYKIVRRDVLQSITLHERRFGIDPELAAKLARYRLHGQKLRIREIPIEYTARTYLDGKKIGLRDALRAVYCILYYNLCARS